MGTMFRKDEDGNNEIFDDEAWDCSSFVKWGKTTLNAVFSTYKNEWRLFSFISACKFENISIPIKLEPIVVETWEYLKDKKMVGDLGFEKKAKRYGYYKKTFSEYFCKYHPSLVKYEFKPIDIVAYPDKYKEYKKEGRL